MEKYKAGSLAEAIRVWAAIYEEIGPKRGFRVSFNLAVAYDSNGEATRAAERYRSFLEEVAVRRAAGGDIGTLVEHERQQAEESLAALDREHGRIEIASGPTPMLERVDDSDPRFGAFTAYVAPGRHVVTFGAGQPDAEELETTVAAGELVVVRPTRISKPLPPVDPIFSPTRRVIKRPFSPIVLYMSGVATAASVVAPALAYSHALSLYSNATSTPSESARNSAAAYPAARTVAYALLSVPIGVGAVSGGLVTWYFVGAEEKTVNVSFNGSSAALNGTF